MPCVWTQAMGPRYKFPVAFRNVRLMNSPGGYGAERQVLQTAAAQILEQQDHLVIVQAGVLRPGLLESSEPLCQFGARATAAVRRFQDRGADELGDELQLVRGQAEQETTGFPSERVLSARSKRSHQILALGNHTNSGKQRSEPYYCEKQLRVQGGG
jgi:hypothetical protein